MGEQSWLNFIGHGSDVLTIRLDLRGFFHTLSVWDPNNILMTKALPGSLLMKCAVCKVPAVLSLWVLVIHMWPLVVAVKHENMPVLITKIAVFSWSFPCFLSRSPRRGLEMPESPWPQHPHKGRWHYHHWERRERGPVPGLVLFNIYISDLSERIECALSKLADGTELGGVADTAEGRAAIQWKLGRMENGREEPDELQQE